MGVYYKDPWVVGQHRGYPSSHGATQGLSTPKPLREM